MDEVLQAIKRAIDASVPYISKYNAFMIPAENWQELAHLVSPRVRAIDALFDRLNKGETLTEDEITRALM